MVDANAIGVGDKYLCPSPRGPRGKRKPDFLGEVIWVAKQSGLTDAGVEYRWVTVRSVEGKESHVPSYRLKEKV